MGQPWGHLFLLLSTLTQTITPHHHGSIHLLYYHYNLKQMIGTSSQEGLLTVSKIIFFSWLLMSLPKSIAVIWNTCQEVTWHIPFTSSFSCRTFALEVFHLSITSLHRSSKGYSCNDRQTFLKKTLKILHGGRVRGTFVKIKNLENSGPLLYRTCTC